MCVVDNRHNLWANNTGTQMKYTEYIEYTKYNDSVNVFMFDEWNNILCNIKSDSLT